MGTCHTHKPLILLIQQQEIIIFYQEMHILHRETSSLLQGTSILVQEITTQGTRTQTLKEKVITLRLDIHQWLCRMLTHQDHLCLERCLQIIITMETGNLPILILMGMDIILKCIPGINNFTDFYFSRIRFEAMDLLLFCCAFSLLCWSMK